MRQIEITKEKYDWILSVSSDDEYFELLIINIKEMRQIAKLLIGEADTIERVNNCPKCHNKMEIDYESIFEIWGQSYEEGNIVPPRFLVQWCESCENSYNGLGESYK